MAVLPMFPLGNVLFPHMPLRLRVFEERYLIMLNELLKADDLRFGVVLIERGREVGGGDQRFGIGTIADVLQVAAGDGFVNLAAHGAERLEVTSWLDDAPHPRAEIRVLPGLVWDSSLESLRERAEHVVRRTLAVASEFAEKVWPPNIELSDDPVEASWQLAGIAPLGAIDQLALLSCSTTEELLVKLIKLTEEAGLTRYTP